MTLKLELLYFDHFDIDLELEIRDYKTTDDSNCWKEWCSLDYSITSGDRLNLTTKDDEVLLSLEVDAIAWRLEGLLSGELTEITELRFAEPDFRMVFHPREDLRKNPRYCYIAPGHEFEDVYLEWFAFETIRMVLNREKCEKLLGYLKEIIANGRLEQ